MVIVDFDYYKNVYNGNAVTNEEEFKKLEAKAGGRVKRNIMNRDYTDWCNHDFSEQVKSATCSVIDILSDIEQKKIKLSSISDNSEKIVTSEKVKDYSKNYATISYKELQDYVSNDNVDKLVLEEMENYLESTGLMSRGVAYVR